VIAPSSAYSLSLATGGIAGIMAGHRCEAESRLAMHIWSQSGGLAQTDL
jgi:hypothetical protein